ncbi:Cysteine/Histidine-rich C1 domain family protein [Euphorbia peplus]|nr:Cysteine/Histidine-rich C1 domain family protein [Euphorbia peplus]
MSQYDPHPKSPNLVEYPASPPIIGEEIVHFGHPQHHLNQVDLPDLFTCAGCKEYGSGKRFSCQQCDFQLHEFCGLAPKLLSAHPLHMQHHLLFSAKPVKGGILKSKCDVCGKATKGYTFKCNACTYQMHPCCAMLSNEMNISVHPHKLRIMPAMSTLPNNGSDGGGFSCGECKKSKRSGRLYRCTVCDHYYLHAVCAKNMVNGLEANGIKGVEQKPTMFGTAAKLASQVIIEFIGGLVEGLGEGVGQALIQSVARGRRPTPRPPRLPKPPTQ